MMPQKPIDYSHELVTFIELVKSNTPAGARILAVLKSGDEVKIRHMLINFGNPNDAEWKDITTASPWSDWQINEFKNDLSNIFIPGTDGPFWAWDKHDPLIGRPRPYER